MSRRILALVMLFTLILSGSAMAQAPTTWHYTAVGSSNASGYLDENKSYNELYRDFVELDNPVKVELHNRAVPDWTSQDVLDEIMKNPARQMEFAQSDIIVWDAGYNELSDAMAQYQAGTCGGPMGPLTCFYTTLYSLMGNADKIAAELHTLRGDKPTLIVMVSAWNNQPAGPWFAMYNQALAMMNAHFAATQAKYGDKFLNLQDILNGPHHDQPVPAEWLAKDGHHLNELGHLQIANALRAMGYAPLR